MNPYRSPNEPIFRAQIAESPAPKSEIARLERTISWLWAHVIFLWVALITMGIALLNAWSP